MIQEIEARFLEKRNLAPAVWLLKFGLLKPKGLEFLAGQYLLLKLNNQRRAYSIASPNYLKDSFELLVKFVPGGLASTFFKNLKGGEKANFLGPFGFFRLKSKEKNKIFFAGGTGLAPIRSQILSILKEKNNLPKLILFWGLKKREEVYFFEELKNLSQKYQNFVFKICLDQEKEFKGLDKNFFFEGRVQMAFLDFLEKSKISNLNDFEYYLCGPPAMIVALKEFLSQKEIKKENIIFEKF